MTEQSKVTKPDYSALDAAVLARLDRGRASFTSLSYAPAIESLCKSLQPADAKRKDEHWRVLDRRLQALRKAGKIRMAQKRSDGWELA